MSNGDVASSQGAVGQFFETMSRGELAQAWQRRQSFLTAGSPNFVARLDAAVGDLAVAESASYRVGDSVTASGLAFTEGAEAIAGLKEGNHTVVAQQVDRLVPWIGDWLGSLLEELGLPVHQAKANVFHSPTGSGLARHFDNHEVLIMGLRGRKVFRVAPNRVVPFPALNDDRYSGEEGLALAEERAAESLPSQQEFELLPGGVLYIPRGWWHATEAVEPSVSVTFGFWSCTVDDVAPSDAAHQVVGRTPLVPDDGRGAQLRNLRELLGLGSDASPELGFSVAKLTMASAYRYRSGLGKPGGTVTESN